MPSICRVHATFCVYKVHQKRFMDLILNMSSDLNVTVTIQYSPPAGVTLTPPNYRAATSVSLRCDVVGTVGSVSYQWSSTCGSSCFVSGSSQTVSRDKLWSYDAGYHTCVATDGAGNTGRANTTMKIIGIYFQYTI